MHRAVVPDNIRKLVQPPFSVARLDDRDDLGGVFVLVDDQGSRRLYRYNSGAMAWASVNGDMVVSFQIAETKRAERLWKKHGTQLTADYRKKITEALRPGQAAEEGLRELWGPHLVGLRLLEEREGQRLYRVLQHYPRRTGRLRLTVDEHGSVRAVQFS
ncbi:MAG: hypothetical protein GXP55_19445 [Deltaproteobacteria bacterium]|nr:hypothetical protein [Deltaproteobacteria bacterium]